MSTDNIENNAIQTYTQNLIYLEKNHTDLYNKIKLYESALELDAIKPIYELQNKNNYFDAININTNQAFYNQNSNTISHTMVEEQVTLESKRNSFKTFYEQNPSSKKAKEALDKDILENYTIGNAPFIKISNDNLPDKELFNKVYKYIIFGVGLGLHIPLIHEKIHSMYYLIVEPSLELFRLSLFVTNYASLGNESILIFSIGQNEYDFKQIFKLFLSYAFVYNHYLKLFKLSPSCDMYIQIVQNHLISQDHLIYSYDRNFSSLYRTNINIQKGYKVLNLKIIQEMSFMNKPILILAAGPSLGKDINFVKDNQDKFLIIAIYATLPILEENGIKPDIITQYDEQNTPVLNTLNKIKDISFFKNSILIFSSHVNQNLLNSFDFKNIFIFQANSELKKGFGTLVSPSIGDFTYGLCLTLNAKEIYLLGLDLAFDPITKASHIEGHSGSSAFEEVREIKDSKIEEFSFRKSSIIVKGNFYEEVSTVSAFKVCIDAFNTHTHTIKHKNCIVYNLSNGAFFNQTIPLLIKDIDISKFETIDKAVFRKTIFNELTINSQINYSKQDLELIDIKISEVKQLKKVIANFYNKQVYKNLDEYRDTLLDLFDTILLGINYAKDLETILQSYAKHNVNFIFYIFNLQNTPNFRTYYKELNKILNIQFNKIIDMYTIGILYSQEKSSKTNKKLAKYIKEYKLEQTYNQALFFHEILETAPLKNLNQNHKKNSLGFFGTKEILKNKNFIIYIKELYNLFPQIEFKIFYYFSNQEELIKNTFKNELNRCELIIPNDIDSISKEIEVWININKTNINLEKVTDILLNKYENIYSLDFDEKIYKNKVTNKIIANHGLSKTIEKKIILPQSNYYTFLYLLKQRLGKKFFDKSYEKNSLGFFALEDNLNDIDFLNYISNIVASFKDIKIKVFYFEESQKNETEKIFIKDCKKFIFIKAEKLENITSNIEILISSDELSKSPLIINLNWQLHFYSNIYSTNIKEEFTYNKKETCLKTLIDEFEYAQFIKNSYLQSKQKSNLKKYKKNSIGLFSNKHTFRNNPFLNQIKDILKNFKEIDFKIYYFEDKYKKAMEDTFKGAIQSFEFIIPKDVCQITQEIELYLYPKELELIPCNILVKEQISQKVNTFSHNTSDTLPFKAKTTYLKNIIPTYTKEKFIKSSLYINDENIKNLFKKDSLGFLICKENIEDNNFISYIKHLYITFPKLEIKAFYFEESDKIFFEKLFKNELERIEEIKITNMFDIVNNISIWCDNTKLKDKNLKQVFLKNLLYKCEKIFYINYDYITFKKKLSIFDNELSKHPFIVDNNFFGFSDKEVLIAKGNISILISNKWGLKIDHDNDSVETFFDKQIILSLKNDSFNVNTTKLANMIVEKLYN